MASTTRKSGKMAIEQGVGEQSREVEDPVVAALLPEVEQRLLPPLPARGRVGDRGCPGSVLHRESCSSRRSLPFMQHTVLFWRTMGLRMLQYTHPPFGKGEDGVRDRESP